MAPAGMSFNVYRPSCCQVLEIQRAISSAVLPFLLLTIIVVLFIHSTSSSVLVCVPLAVKNFATKRIPKGKGVVLFVSLVVMHHNLVERGKRKKTTSVCYVYRLSRYLSDLLVHFFVDLLLKTFWVEV